MRYATILIFFFFPVWVTFAYDAATTHAGITEQAVNFYESKFLNIFSSLEKEQLIRGSIDEDNPSPRVLNHFYDPIRNIGINNFRTAKDWAMFQNIGNYYTWQEAIQAYAKGDKSKAFFVLGHTMHLIQDMTVPDHTRNDAHVGNGATGLFTGDSTYEIWAQKNKYRGNLNYLNISLNNQKPIVFGKLEDYFIFLANYSNRNFFGDDSIVNSVFQYEEPKIVEYKSIYTYGFDNLVKQKIKLSIFEKNKKGVISYSLADKDQYDTSVLSSYFSRLSKQAVLAGAGVIDLFFREGEKARAEYLSNKIKLADAEIKKAIELNKRLGNSNLLGLALSGFSFIIQDNIINPVTKTASNIGGSFSLGSQLITSVSQSVTSFLTFSANVVVSQTIASAKVMLSNAIASAKSLLNGLYNNNLATVSGTTTIAPKIITNGKDTPAEEATITNVAVPPTATKAVIVANTAALIASLESARSILDDLSRNLAAQPIKEIPKMYAPTPYSAGFGGGGDSLALISTHQEPSLTVDKGVDNVGTIQEKSVETTVETAAEIVVVAVQEIDVEQTTEIVAESTTETVAEADIVVVSDNVGDHMAPVFADEEEGDDETEEIVISPAVATSTVETVTVVASTTTDFTSDDLSEDIDAPSEEGIVIESVATSTSETSFELASTTEIISDDVTKDTDSENATSTDSLTDVFEDESDTIIFEIATSTATTTPENDDEDVVGELEEIREEVVEEIIEIIVPDTTPPDISLEIKECANSLASDGCLLNTSSLTIVWSSGANDLSFFEINNGGSISTTTATSTALTILDGSSLIFSVFATDFSGNKSEKIMKSASVSFIPVAVNEIAWNGTAGHAEDQWIELFNRTDKTIDLDNWILYSKTTPSLFLKLIGDILPRDYYLIERKNDGETSEPTQSPVKNIEADLWASFGVGVRSLGDNLVLSYSSTTIDEVPLFNYSLFGGLRTLERYNPNLPAISTNWMANNAEIINGKSVTGGGIFGTPKARNSANYLINKGATTISQNLTLAKDNSPYYIQKNTFLNISAGVTLTINPGVVIKFGESAGVSVLGNIFSVGDEGDPIVFTALRDDEYGGDTNGDGVCDRSNALSTALCPSPGLFYGIWFSNKIATSTISHSIFRYGGIASGVKNGIIYSDFSPLSVSNSIVEYSSTNGIALKNSNSVFLENISRNNSLLASYSGANISGGSVKIGNNTFANNGNGIYSNYSDLEIKDNKFSQNKYKAMTLTGSITNTISGNTSLESGFASNRFINLSGTISKLNATTTLSYNSMPYFIDGNVSTIASSTLYIGEGVRITNNYTGTASNLSIGGKLIIDGTLANPVIFSSDKEIGVKNSWKGITISGISSIIKGTIFKDAGKAISYFKSPISLEDAEFRNNDVGIYIGTNPSPVIKAINVIFGTTNTATTSPKGLW